MANFEWSVPLMPPALHKLHYMQKQLPLFRLSSKLKLRK